MFLVDWREVASPGLLVELRDLAGADGPDDSVLRPLVAAIFASVGGLPVTAEDWPEEHCRAVGRRLLHEAVGRVLRVRGKQRRPLPGVEVLPDSKSSDFRQASPLAVARVDVNRATVEQLEVLPVLGSVLSRRLVDERRVGGPFTDAVELASRVHGVGEQGADVLRPRIHAERSLGGPAGEAFLGDFEADFRQLVGRASGATAHGRLYDALEMLAQECATNLHPATRARAPRDELAPSAGGALGWLDVQDVTILEDELYHPTVRRLLENATHEVELAMFFIAMPGPTHPTRELLDAMVAAKQRGAEVRVLVDRDHEDDPYGSRIINVEAADYLTQQGISVRHDSENVLLHSKFLVVDDRATVIGSHNWTVGSYSRYHDLSVLLHGPAVATSMRARFDALWSEGLPHQPA